MNPENARRWAALHRVPWHESPSGVITARLHDGSTFVSARAPHTVASRELEPGSETLPEAEQRYADSDPVGRTVTNSLRAMFRLSERTHAVSSDARFSELGRADALKADRETAIAHVSHDFQKLREREIELAEREHEIFAVPQLAPGDSVGAIADWEIRQNVAGLSPEDRAALHAKLARGEPETERIALALNRSPYPLGATETVARTAWRETAKRKNADAFAALERDQEQHAWGVLTVRRIAERVAKLAELSGPELYDAAAKLSIARPHGPAAFFSNPAELRAQATRWGTQQAKAQAA